MKSSLILVTGPCGSGKTVMANKLSVILDIPVICKDTIKELLYDHIGTGDTSFARKQGAASYAILNLIAKTFLKYSPLIVESNFSPKGLQEFTESIRLCELSVFIVSCYAEPDVLFRRVRRRIDAGERHLGHPDATDYQIFLESVYPADSYRYNDMAELLVIDTSNFESVDYLGIARQAQRFLENGDKLNQGGVVNESKV